jgi:peptide/nickel transport system permease protein
MSGMAPVVPIGGAPELDLGERETVMRRRLRRYLVPAIGLAVIAFWLVIMIIGPLIAPYAPNAVELTERLLPPSGEHPFGTDDLGRDVLSRVLYGVQLSLPTGVAVVIIAVTGGTLFGATAAYVGGRVEEGMMRIADVFLAFPPLILAMAVAAALGIGVVNAVVAMVVVWWPQYARLSRSLVLVQRDQEYVQAAHVLGYGPVRTLIRHILPNAIGPLIVLMTLDVGNAIITFAGLSFLGLGVTPPTAEWGAMVSAGRLLIDQWWVATFPGLAIISVVLGFNFMGDGVRDWLDPRSRRR